jgi:hypothetical protein
VPNVERVALAHDLHAVPAPVEVGVGHVPEAAQLAPSRSTGIPTMMPHSVHEPSYTRTRS